jgi:hypothetical protein
MFGADTELLFEVRYTLMPLVRGIHVGAKALLAHFHFICKGQKPLELDWGAYNSSSIIRRMAKVSPEEANFLNHLAQINRRQGKKCSIILLHRPGVHLTDSVAHFVTLLGTHDYEADHWFTGQLLVPDWKPPSTLEHSPPAELMGT